MAFQKVGSPVQRYLALSGDILSTDETVIGLGAKLTIVDTGKKLIFYNGAWITDKELIYAIEQGTEV